MILTKRCRRHKLRFGFGLVCLFASAAILYVSQPYRLLGLCGEVGPLRSLQMKTQLFQSLHLPHFGQVNCTGIIQGVQSDVEEALLDNLKIANKRLPVTEQEYLNLTKDCNHYKVRRQFIPIPLSKEEENFPIAYSMVVHEKIEMFERLLRAIYAPQNIYCVHVDDKSPEIYKQAIRAIASCFGNVFVASKLERMVYASWLRVQADLNCMEDLLKSEVQWRYLLNTCGTDFPIKTNAEIVRTLKFLNGRNSLESEKTPEHKKRRWQFHYEVNVSTVKTDIPKSPPPIKSPMFAGNAYFVVSRDFVEYIFKKDTDVEELLEWEKDTYSPDEHLWATLQRMPGVPGSSPYHDKYHLSDMNAVARLVKWHVLEGDVSKGATYPPCTSTHQRGVCVYGAGDLNWMFQHHHLFANKFDPTVDNTAIQCLEEYLRLKALHGIEL